MSNEDLLENDSEERGDEFELDSEVSEDLESAMQEALAAVEKASQEVESDAQVAGIEAVPGTRRTGPGAVEGGGEETELSELRDRFVRTMADFDNFRKRVERERADERRYAAADVFKELLKVIDNLERAVAAKGSPEDLKQGVELILRQMHDLLTKSGVSRVEAMGQEFDPRFHEAVTKHEVPDVAAPTVSDEMQSGYLLHDRLLRPSIVKVAMPTSRTDKDEPPKEDAE